MLPSDSKDINEKFNNFQSIMSNTSSFTNMFGSVTFRDNDASTTLEFVNQLLIVKDQEIKGYMEEQVEPTEESSPERDKPEEMEESKIETRAKDAKSYLDNDDFEAAKAIIGKSDEILWWVLQAYNTSGIEHRRQGRFREALDAFKKALSLQPEDEGLYYNISRIHIELNEWNEALRAIQEALKINPEFNEGRSLESFIRKNS